MGSFIDLTARRFGKLTVLSRCSTESRKKTYYLCLCDCGNHIVVRSDSLSSGKYSKLRAFIRRHGSLSDNLEHLKMMEGSVL